MKFLYVLPTIFFPTVAEEAADHKGVDEVHMLQDCFEIKN